MLVRRFLSFLAALVLGLGLVAGQMVSADATGAVRQAGSASKKLVIVSETYRYYNYVASVTLCLGALPVGSGAISTKAYVHIGAYESYGPRCLVFDGDNGSTVYAHADLTSIVSYGWSCIGYV